MAEPILLREIDSNGLYAWLDLAASEAGVQRGQLADLASLTENRALILVWPAASVLLLEVELPLRHAAQINKALPFALEELLAEDVEHYHWVWQRQPGSQKLAVAAVAHRLMNACRQSFDAAGITLSMALPESLLLPWQAEQPGWLTHDGHCVFRYAQWLGGGGETELCRQLVQKLPHTAQTVCEWQLWCAADQAEDFQILNESMVNLRHHVLNEPLTLYASQWSSAQSMNLLSGDYAPKPRQAASLKAWWPAAAIWLLALMLQCAGQWQLLRQQQQQLQALQAGNEALFKQTFPDIKRLVNLKAQAEQELSQLQQHSQTRQSGFLALLYQTGPSLQQPQLKLQRLQFADQRLQMRVLSTDKAGIEQVQTQLNQVDGLQVELGGTNSGPKGEEADFVIQHR